MAQIGEGGGWWVGQEKARGWVWVVGVLGWWGVYICGSLRANNSSAPADVGSRVSFVHRRASVGRHTIGAAAPWGGEQGVGGEERKHGQKRAGREIEYHGKAWGWVGVGREKDSEHKEGVERVGWVERNNVQGPRGGGIT